MNSQDGTSKESDKRLIRGYENILLRTEQSLTSTTTHSENALSQALETAREKAIELGELTRNEAEKLHDFVTRDLYDAGQHLAMEGREIADWLRLSLLIAETTLLNSFTTLAQAAKTELVHLKKAKQRLDEWHTGEITTIGTLCCRNCGEHIHFNHTGHIPPCPKCHATIYERVKK